MATFKCKMCGAPIEFEEGASVCECAFCNINQTLPKLSDDRRANLYDRANHFRRANEYDKAAGIYEQILNEDTSDAEAYWSLVLCTYGIEYVEDPASRKRVPTVNRAQYTSIYADENYKSAIACADASQKEIYESEAKQIDDIQKGILAISQKEEPFDVFICYKETEADGKRTRDSVYAHQIYHSLTNEGFKVFFARVTLEDKLGNAYEPYIFAALNSAKVMVVLGTKPEYFNAVWVKNEWSRYLSLVKNSHGMKTLIPAYRDMVPYDLPEELSLLQALDMASISFMQDLVHAVKRIIRKDEPKPAVQTVTVQGEGGVQVRALLDRAYIFLGDRDWAKADEYAEKVLDRDPKNAEAYLVKLLTELHVTSKNALRNQEQPFRSSGNYQKVIRFGSEDLKKEMEEINVFIIKRNEEARLNAAYARAEEAQNSAETEQQFLEAGALFEMIRSYKDADARIEECRRCAEEARQNGIYARACSAIGGEPRKVQPYVYAAELFGSIPGWKDADEKYRMCVEKQNEMAIAEKDDTLESGKRYMNERDYGAALGAFQCIPGWKDADACAATCREKLQVIAEQKRKEAEEENKRKQKEEARLAVMRENVNKPTGFMFIVFSLIAGYVALTLLVVCITSPPDGFYIALFITVGVTFIMWLIALCKLSAYKRANRETTIKTKGLAKVTRVFCIILGIAIAIVTIVCIALGIKHF